MMVEGVATSALNPTVPVGAMSTDTRTIGHPAQALERETTESGRNCYGLG